GWPRASWLSKTPRDVKWLPSAAAAELVMPGPCQWDELAPYALAIFDVASASTATFVPAVAWITRSLSARSNWPAPAIDRPLVKITLPPPADTSTAAPLAMFTAARCCVALRFTAVLALSERFAPPS